MQRSRTSEAPQRPASKPRGTRNHKISSSGSISERTPKLGIPNRQSDPRSVQSEPVRQRKLDTRITDLETQLVQAQHELKCLKQQLSSAETAKKQAQKELQGKKEAIDKPEDEETDVFEVPETKNKCVCDVRASNGEEIDNTRSDLEEKEKKMKVIIEENETVKRQLEEAKLQVESDKKKEEEMTSRMNKLVQELETNKAETVKLEEKVLELKEVKESLEVEMKKMKVQTEQWRKAADAAAAVLAGGTQMNCRGSEGCGSIYKHFDGTMEKPFNGNKEYLGDYDVDDDFDGGKKKGSGIKMLGDLWKKKSQR